MSAPTPPDTYRIKRILNKLETAWSADNRVDLDSLLVGLLGSNHYTGFFDEELEKSLDRYLKDHKVEGWKS